MTSALLPALETRAPLLHCIPAGMSSLPGNQDGYGCIDGFSCLVSGIELNGPISRTAILRTGTLYSR